MKLPRHGELWLPGLLRARARQRAQPLDAAAPVTVHLMFADHYEPYWNTPTDQVARQRVQAWADRWPAIAHGAADHDGRPAQWSFFYPQEEYRPELLALLADLTRAGLGDVEVHIHHDGEGEQDFVGRMQGFLTVLRRDHELLHDVDGRPVFGFIHGNWALDNSHPSGRWCGLNNELTLLRELGCYADFTMPAAPDPCQTTLVNAIYWAVDDPLRAKSHDHGPLVVPGVPAPANALLCVQGPLALGRHPRWRALPTLDVGELAGYAAPSPARAVRWITHAPRIGNDIFVKLFTHGAPEKNASALLGGHIANTVAQVRSACEVRGWQLRHATAWEMYQRILAAASPRSAGALTREAPHVVAG